MASLIKKLPMYLLIAIIVFSAILHIYFLMKHPGENFTQIPPKELEQMVEDGDMSEATAKLKEHTWIYGSRDAYLYSKMANQIIEHGVYGFDTHNTGIVESNAFVTPGYPLILVLLFSAADLISLEQMTMVKLFNMVISIGTVYLIYLITAKVFKNRWMGVAASGLYAVYFPPLHYFRMALTEIPAIFFFCLAIYLFLIAFETNKKLFHFLFAVVFCYGIMIRPVIAPLVLIALAIMIIKYWKHHKQWLAAGVIWSFGAMVVILPWVIRNFILFNEFILFSTHSGNSWYAGSNPFNIYPAADYLEEKESLGMDQKEFAHMKIKEGFQNDFGLWLSWFTVGKTYELFKIPDGIYFYSHWALSYIKKMHLLVVIIAFLTAFISRKKETLAITAILVMYILLSNLFLTIPRYGFFIMPIVCMLTGYAAVTIINRLKSIIRAQSSATL